MTVGLFPHKSLASEGENGCGDVVLLARAAGLGRGYGVLGGCERGRADLGDRAFAHSALMAFVVGIAVAAVRVLLDGGDYLPEYFERSRMPLAAVAEGDGVLPLLVQGAIHGCEAPSALLTARRGGATVRSRGEQLLIPAAASLWVALGVLLLQRGPEDLGIDN